ncbi:MAG: polyribonucleotide nucleotidyltransferase [Candidatus Woesebacteria bacterium]|jgi:polyribonucleotide nucleotidyltransferase
MSYPQYGNTYKKDIKVGDKVISLEIGKFSEQTAAAVLARCGDTVVHSTIALGGKVDWGYFPLNVEYFEKLYAGGIIKGSRWVKREGRPSDDAILKARVIDRSIRPLFPEGIKNQVQVVNTVFSFDNENDPDMVALLATTVALGISEIPFLGPVAGLRVGYHKKSKKFSINPSFSERESSDLDLIVSGSEKSIVMVEAGANEVSEAEVIEAMGYAQEQLAKICKQIDIIVKEIGKEKIDLVEEVDKEELQALEELKNSIEQDYAKAIKTVVLKQGKLEPTGLDELLEEINTDVLAKTEPDEAVATEQRASEEAKASAEIQFKLTERHVKQLVQELMKKYARKMILEEGLRPDGRKAKEIRPIFCEIDVLPRTHGSAMFKRGATQDMTVTTLGNPSLAWYIEGLEGEEVRHYIHHYNMPPFASGEAGRFGWPKRREIGHGSLAERALSPMVPDQKDFPYTIRVVSEILSSNGSTSQAAVCGSTLSLMAAGVPIKKPVAGIAMGLMSDGEKYVILSDIQGLEDHVGDMDFKVAGSKDGITAIQMDIKLTGIPRQILEQALEQAKVGRLNIMDKMLKTIAQPRKSISDYAPKVMQLTIPADRIGELIGPGGKVIKSIIEVTGADVNVDEDEEKKLGVVNISSQSQEQIDHAVQMITDLMRVIEVNDEFDGEITRIEDYGIFVALPGGKEGLVHVSAMSVDYVKDPRAMFQIGETVHVRVSEIKEDGKLSLTMLTEEQEETQKQASRERRSRNGGSRNGRDGGRRNFGFKGKSGTSRRSSRVRDRRPRS